MTSSHVRSDLPARFADASKNRLTPLAASQRSKESPCTPISNRSSKHPSGRELRVGVRRGPSLRPAQTRRQEKRSWPNGAGPDWSSPAPVLGRPVLDRPRGHRRRPGRRPWGGRISAEEHGTGCSHARGRDPIAGIGIAPWLSKKIVPAGLGGAIVLGDLAFAGNAGSQELDEARASTSKDCTFLAKTYENRRHRDPLRLPGRARGAQQPPGRRFRSARVIHAGHCSVTGRCPKKEKTKSWVGGRQVSG